MKRIGVIVLLIFAIIAIVVLIILSQPSIYEGEVTSTVNAINKINSSLTLAIYTDIHHDPKNEVDLYKETLECIGEVGRKTNIDALWNLGDIINGHTTTKDEAIVQIKEVTDIEDKITKDAHRIQGNHDNNTQATYESNAGYGAVEILTNEELNSVLENTNTTQTEYHSHLRSTDYYVDYDYVGIRVVCISAEDTTFLPETAEWLSSVAFKTDHQVLMLAHCPTRPEWGFKEDIQGGELIEDSLREFISSGGTIIAYIHGHDHGDMISDAGEWKEIAIGCARFQVPTSNGTPGMTFQDRRHGDATKFLFDIVCIDKEKRQVFFIRFGAGDDRVTSY